MDGPMPLATWERVLWLEASGFGAWGSESKGLWIRDLGFRVLGYRVRFKV